MDVADIITIMDLHGFEDSEEDDKVSAINDALQEICTREPWPFLEIAVDIDETDVGADGLVTLDPAQQSILDIFVTDGSGGKLRWVRRDEHMERNFQNLDEAGTPYWYFFIGDGLYVWPIPGSSTAMRVTYLQLQDLLDADSVEADILLPARHHRLIALGAIVKLHAQEDDPENAALFSSQYEQKLILLRQDMFKKQWDSPDSIRVVDEDDWDYDA